MKTLLFALALVACTPAPTAPSQPLHPDFLKASPVEQPCPSQSVDKDAPPKTKSPHKENPCPHFSKPNPKL